MASSLQEFLMLLPVLASCDGCGACCQEMIVPPFRIDHEFNEPLHKGVPQDLVEEFINDWKVRLSLPAQPCCWWDPASRRCRNYEWRPEACREFELNGPACRAVRATIPEDLRR